MIDIRKNYSCWQNLNSFNYVQTIEIALIVREKSETI